MLHLVLPLLAHVPTYGGGIEGCFTPPHHHDISQVIYLRGSGGLEIHCSADGGCPFDLAADEILDVDAVFRDKIDQTTYSLYIGCGGCVSSQDPIVIPAVHLTGYEPAVIEPFTQTRYSSVFPKEKRKYNSSGLRYSVCDQGHFTIRLVRTPALPSCRKSLTTNSPCAGGSHESYRRQTDYMGRRDWVGRELHLRRALPLPRLCAAQPRRDVE